MTRGRTAATVAARSPIRMIAARPGTVRGGQRDIVLATLAAPDAIVCRVEYPAPLTDEELDEEAHDEASTSWMAARSTRSRSCAVIPVHGHLE